LDEGKNPSSQSLEFLKQINQSNGLEQFRQSPYEAEMLSFYDGIVGALEGGTSNRVGRRT
jgi:hypothetical protein